MRAAGARSTRFDSLLSASESDWICGGVERSFQSRFLTTIPQAIPARNVLTFGHSSLVTFHSAADACLGAPLSIGTFILLVVKTGSAAMFWRRQEMSSHLSQRAVLKKMRGRVWGTVSRLTAKFKRPASAFHLEATRVLSESTAPLISLLSRNTVGLFPRILSTKGERPLGLFGREAEEGVGLEE